MSYDAVLVKKLQKTTSAKFCQSIERYLLENETGQQN